MLLLAAADPAPTLKAFTPQGLIDYIQQQPPLAARVGPPGSAASWSVREVGDGNINFVFIVKGPLGGVCIKQSLPFVRCVGESWPLSQVRLVSLLLFTCSCNWISLTCFWGNCKHDSNVTAV